MSSLTRLNELVQSLSSSDDMSDLHRQTTVWSASLDGQIVGWDPVTLTAKKEVKKFFLRTIKCLELASNVLRSRIAEGDWVSSRTWSYRDAVKSPFIKKENKLRRKYVLNLLNEPQHMAKIKTPKLL